MKADSTLWMLMVLCLLATGGCKKDSSPPEEPQTLLRKSITSSQTTTYEYDADNRAIKFEATFSNPVNNYTGFYTYNSAGQLAEVLYSGSGDDTKSVYFYNSSGQITKVENYIVSAGVAALSSKWDALYTTPGKISVYETPNGGIPALYVEYFLDAKGNIEKQLSYNVSGILVSTTENADFDNKPAPGLSVPKTGFARNVNNYQKVIVTPAGGSPSTGTYTYEYNSDGFPTKRTANSGAIITYEYIKK